MEMIVKLELRVKLEGDRANANEIFKAVKDVADEVKSRLVLAIVECYQEEVVEVLSRGSGSRAKKGLGSHERKGGEGERCRGRTFHRAGNWSESRRLRGDGMEVEFVPAMVECVRCGKRQTPVLGALELEPYETRTDDLERKVMEAVADTSYRRGRDQLEVLGEVPVAR